ncbi:PdaC/SigV domain-containing protein, partial [Escherichia sp. R-CC3]
KESLNYKKIYKNGDIKFKYEGYSNFDVTYDKNNLISIPVEFYEFTGGVVKAYQIRPDLPKLFPHTEKNAA